MTELQLLKRTRFMIAIFIFGLVISGLTAIPLVWGANLLLNIFSPQTFPFLLNFAWLLDWLNYALNGLLITLDNYPFLAYGTDWLAFGHISIALFFTAAYKQPQQNSWVLKYGMFLCLMVIPWSFTFGPLRGIPWQWRLIDSSFGVFGLIPLLLANHYIKKLDEYSAV